ncbi:protein FAM161A isoform X2 [Calypte anna]|uniref:protein FAM161A isoform X2 n=1 Tax=Calypte anna TaxID=9244 RepID=UPI0011C3B108|nr:protein FAM161A isoform X2 [Calypte anna]
MRTRRGDGWSPPLPPNGPPPAAGRGGSGNRSRSAAGQQLWGFGSVPSRLVPSLCRVLAMEAAHRAARLAASCLRTPLDPRTRAPAALYERGPPPAAPQIEASAMPKAKEEAWIGFYRRELKRAVYRPWQKQQIQKEDGSDLDSNTDREQTLSLNGSSDKWMDLSKMCSSNQEYYLKLEELKNAHLETIAKLESMYQNKVYFKGVQRLDKKNTAPNMCCRPTWEKSSYQPLNFHRSFSDSDLSDPLDSSISDGTDRELEGNGSETGSSSFAKQQIEKMWDGFSVKDYIFRIKHSLPSSPVFRVTRKKQKAWSPKVTVPKPFQMTIREARKKEKNVKSKSQMEMENSLLKKQLEEEAECQKKFRANPVPAAVFLPLYHEIVQRNEERRRSVKERSKLKLLASQKPFKFIEREKQRSEIRKMQLRDLSIPEKKTRLFKAKPVPKYVYSSAVNDKLKEEELYREIRIRMRAEELLRNSSLPNSRLALKDNLKKKHKCIELKGTEHKPKIKSNVPDFDLLHQKFQERLLQQKQVKHLTVCEPFHLLTPYIPSNKGKILKDIEDDERKLKETRWPYASPRLNPQMRHSSANSHLSGFGASKSPKITESTRRRLQAIRNYEKQRMQEYLQELQEMEERVNQRPLLLERVTQKNARIAAEKHYSDRLRALGICPEFISKKGQTTKLLQGSNAEDFRNTTDARERVMKDIMKDIESFEEAADSILQSEQSCEERKQEEEGEKKKDVKISMQDGQSSELEDEEEARVTPQPCHAGEFGSSPSSGQHHEGEEEEEAEAKTGLPLGHSQEEKEGDNQSRPSSRSDRFYEYEEEGQSDPEDEDAFRYEDEEYENYDSEEKSNYDDDDEAN